MSELTPDNDPGSRVLAVFLLGAAVLFALSPLLTEPFSGFTEDQLPIPQMDPPVQPAGYAFSIWGVIYLWLIASTGFGLFRRDTDPRWSGSRLPLARRSWSWGVGLVPGGPTPAPSGRRILIWVNARRRGLGRACHTPERRVGCCARPPWGSHASWVVPRRAGFRWRPSSRGDTGLVGDGSSPPTTSASRAAAGNTSSRRARGVAARCLPLTSRAPVESEALKSASWGHNRLASSERGRSGLAARRRSPHGRGRAGAVLRAPG